jgi:transcriptional regulator with XRE-family HTH domain
MRNPNLTTLAKIAKALDVEPWELLCDHGIDAPEPTGQKTAPHKKPSPPDQPT